MRTVRASLLFAVFAALCVAQQSATVAGCPAFPTNSIWNTPIDNMPVSPRSADYINTISYAGGLRYDDVIGITVVPGTQPKVPINITYPAESDAGPYPIPPDAHVETVTDKHVILVDKDNCMLYETYNSVLQPDGSWNVESSAKWSLLSNGLRPLYWTSADAAGLPILPGLVRYEEVAAGEINHALRFTTPNTQRLFLWPARHYASTSTSVTLPPMGQRFRLKADFDITPYSAQMQVVLRALKKYGLILADNGLPWEMQFASDPRWDPQQLVSLRSVAGSNFEAVDVSGLMVSPDSAEADQLGGVKVSVSPASVTLGPGQAAQFTANVAFSNLGVVWSMNPSIGTLSSTGLYTAPATISSAQTVTITATLVDGTRSGTASVVLQPAAAPKLASVAVSPTTFVGGTNVNVTVTLTLPALAAGAVVTLTGSNAAFPSTTVMIGGGLVFQTFSVPTAVVASTTAGTVTAAFNGNTVTSAPFTVNPAAPSGTANFLKLDSTTGGTWKGVYGADGYNVISNSAKYPGYVTVTTANAGVGSWADTSSDPRAVQKAESNDRIGGHWYNPTSFTVDLNFSDTTSHQVAIYLLDWGSDRKEQVDILDTHDYVLDSKTVTNFHDGLYLVWNLSGHVKIRFTNNNTATNAVMSGLFFGGAGAVSAPAPATGTAVFVKADSTTGGNWKGVYGADGYNILGNKSAYPAYVGSAAMSGGGSYTWAATTTDPGALQKADAADRIGSQWFGSPSYKIDVSFTDANSHKLSLYLYDPENIRVEKVEILDANYTVLDTQTASSFKNGRYLSWNVSGHILVRITTTTSIANASISGLFFDPPAPPATATLKTIAISPTAVIGGSTVNITATLTAPAPANGAVVSLSGSNAAFPPASVTILAGRDAQTFSLPTLAVATDAHVTITGSYNGGSVTASELVVTSVPPTLTSMVISPSSSVVGGGKIDISLTLSGKAPSTGAIVLVSSSNPAFAATSLTLSAGLTNQVFSVSTPVVTTSTALTLTATYNGSSLSSQLTLTPSIQTPTPSATFIGTDTSTQGSWKAKYGAEGYNVLSDRAVYPSYVTVTPAGQAAYTWVSSTTDPRALQKTTNAGDRIAGCWFSSSSFTIDLTFRDSTVHQVALYMVDWNLLGRAQKVEVITPNGMILDTRTIAGFSGGQYLVWNMSGHIVIRMTNTVSGANAVVGGLFFGSGGPAGEKATVNFVRTDTTTSGDWTSVYGNDGYSLIGSTSTYPSYLKLAATGYSSYTWAGTTSDPRGLEKTAAGTDRIAACWYSPSVFAIDLTFTDGATHQISIYMLDWNKTGRTQTVEVLDSSNAVLDSRNVSNFTSGQYLVWNVSGHVVVRVTNTNPLTNAVISGMFFR